MFGSGAGLWGKAPDEVWGAVVFDGGVVGELADLFSVGEVDASDAAMSVFGDDEFCHAGFVIRIVVFAAST